MPQFGQVDTPLGSTQGGAMRVDVLFTIVQSSLGWADSSCDDSPVVFFGGWGG